MTEGSKGDVVGKVLKRDAHGRVHSTQEHRAAVLAEFERSGLTGPQFARAAGVPYQTFTTWRKRQGKAQGEGTDGEAVVSQHVEPVALRFAEAMVRLPETDAAACPPLLVRLAGGASFEITEAAHLPLAVQLIQALARSC